ncbi:MAG: lipid-transfer protein [Sphingobium sp.]
MRGFGDTAIAGIGATEFSKGSGRSEMRLALDAIMAALRDAGLSPDDVDGLVTYVMDNSPQSEVARNLGLANVTFMSQTPFGGGGCCAVVQHACMAVMAGVAKTVVCYRALNGRSGAHRYGAGRPAAATPAATSDEVHWGWYRPHGLVSPPAYAAIVAKRYMQDYGATSADFGQVSVLARAHAATNPKAWFYRRPITLEDHQQSRLIADPLRLLDCCQETDGAVAIVVTSVARARDLRRTPVVVQAAAQGMGPDQEVISSFYRPRITGSPEMAGVGSQLWRQSGLRPEDMDALILYDHFTPYVLIQLEELGFCGLGEAPALVASGALALGGRWPLNPHGGLLAEAYIQGLNGIAEAVRQLRGDAANQIADPRHILVAADAGVPTSGLILGLAA